LQLSKDMADASVFNDENHSSEAGLKGGTIPFSARFKRAEAALLIAAWNTDATSKVLYRPEGDGAGKFQSFADYHIGQLEIGSSLSDTVSLTGTFTRDGAVATGVQA
ncbi:MAG TPA: hypothetical protein VNM48_03610, partial [Chloroflexota bacterium]|nr:hypothetical protein [Chloroflexota bacterium]